MSQRKLSEPLRTALSLQRAAAREGFDWKKLEELWDKLHEEIGELRAARTHLERQEELGDLLFMLVNLARHMEVDPAQALTAANRKFKRRYGYVMKHGADLPPLRDPSRIDAMEALWQQAKQLEKLKPAG
jgi:uncharacterized protein YabN with tetrapyrrole methylase and pyrophosphatase domain